MFRKPIHDPKTMITIGMLFMVLASLSKLLLHRVPNVSEDAADGITGFLYGITLGSLGLGVWLRSRRHDGTRKSSCS